jgi:hypothetical protein
VLVRANSHSLSIDYLIHARKLTSMHPHTHTHTHTHAHAHTHSRAKTASSKNKILEVKLHYTNVNQIISDSVTVNLTISLPAVKTLCLSLVKSSHTLVNWHLNNFWSDEPIFNQCFVFLKTSNALCICLQYKHPRSLKRVISSDKPVTLLLLLWSPKCDFGAEPSSRIIATWAVN